jgi:hypothetical protein
VRARLNTAQKVLVTIALAVAVYLVGSYITLGLVVVWLGASLWLFSSPRPTPSDTDD